MNTLSIFSTTTFRPLRAPHSAASFLKICSSEALLNTLSLHPILPNAFLKMLRSKRTELTSAFVTPKKPSEQLILSHN